MPDSDETTEIIERPSGGESIIYCNGKRNGQPNKTISSIIVNRVLEKVAENFRDSTAIKSVSDQIYREHSGHICGDLCMISTDFQSETIVVSRCTNVPVYFYQRGFMDSWHTPAEQIGAVKVLHPSITEIPMEPGTTILMLSEGALNAGKNTMEADEIEDLILSTIEESSEFTADNMAEFFLKRAITLDSYKPQEDMTVIVLKVCSDSPSFSRKIFLTCPVPKYQSIY
ncbi:MAG: SpoIIE family protein phosphatase [Anaerolineaceae bacterium]|nr:SpoIIE family protein phosphatase [Anaerolineaceae bacterium]